METLKLLFLIYVKPWFAFSEIMDRGSWLIAAGITIVVGILFFFTVNVKFNAAYQMPAIADYYDELYHSEIDTDQAERYQANALEKYQQAVRNKRNVPIVGARFFSFFSFETSAFYQPAVAISIFYVPVVILCVSLFAGIASFGLLFRRDYAVIATCTMPKKTRAPAAIRVRIPMRLHFKGRGMSAKVRKKCTNRRDEKSG